MRNPSLRRHRSWFVVPAVAFLLLASSAWAQSGPALGTVRKAGVKRSRTLGDVAGWIVLNHPEGSSPNQRIVISDHTITQTSRLGVVSEGRSLWKPSREQEERQRQAAVAAQEAWTERIDRQRHEVEQLQQRLQRMDRWRTGRQDNYPGQSSPHNRPGGVQSQSQMQREQTQRELAEAQARLNRRIRAARREGYGTN